MGGVLLIAALAAALGVWELVVCEGAHLGRRFVVCLYDLLASRYDGIKGFDPEWEDHTVGEPLAAAVGSLRGARLLDAGAGTGRAARALLRRGPLDGLLVCLEPSRRMLALGRRLSADLQVPWVRGWAVPLPFAAGTFDIVVSLELLEFTPCPLVSLAELVRVLRPGGWLLVTNRVGRSAPWILGRTTRRAAFPALLASQGLEAIEVSPWQVEYDLAWARKRWDASPAA